MYYLEKSIEWFHELEWKRQAVLAAVLGLVFGVGSTITGGAFGVLLLFLLLLDFITDDVLGVHE